jgi:hypothetical protein
MRAAPRHHPGIAGIGDALGGAALALLLGLGACSQAPGFAVEPGTLGGDGAAFHPLRRQELPASF